MPQLPVSGALVFAVVLSDPHKTRAADSLELRLFFDGVRSEDFVMRSSLSSNVVAMRDTVVSETERRTFQFAALELTGGLFVTLQPPMNPSNPSRRR